MKEVNPVGGSDGEVQGRIHNVSESQRRATLDPNHLSLLTNEIHANKLYYYYYYYYLSICTNSNNLSSNSFNFENFPFPENTFYANIIIIRGALSPCFSNMTPAGPVKSIFSGMIYYCDLIILYTLLVIMFSLLLI